MSEKATVTQKVKSEKSMETTEKRESSKSKNASESSLNMTELRELADLIDKHGFTDFEFENENIRVRLRKELAPQIVQAVTPIVQPIAAQRNDVVSTKLPETPPHPGAKAESEAAADEDLFKITSPIVGTFYSSPAPDKPSFVSIGDNISDSSVVCIVEAMKLMNEILAETSGEVVKIYVENGQPVEYGQPLFGIRK